MKIYMITLQQAYMKINEFKYMCLIILCKRLKNKKNDYLPAI